jgi:hypothetical protein
MERRYEIEQIWGLSVPHGPGWQQNNCPAVRNGYGELEKVWKRITKTMAEHQRDFLMKEVETAIQRQKTFRSQQRASGDFVSNPVCITRWLNEKRWKNDVILESEDEKPSKAIKKCRFEGCIDDVWGPMFSMCAIHYHEWAEEQRKLASQG